MYYHDCSAMSRGITQRVLKKELQYHLAHSALAPLGKNKQRNPVLQRKHDIKTQTFANKCTQVNAFHSQYSTEQLQHVQKVTFVSRKIQTVCTQLKVGQTQTDTKMSVMLCGSFCHVTSWLLKTSLLTPPDNGLHICGLYFNNFQINFK